MALFGSGNPTLSQKTFDKSISTAQDGIMTVRGTITKFGFLLLMVTAGAAFTWYKYYNDQTASMMTLFWVGLIGGLVSSLIISFKPSSAPYLAPAYALLEGLAIGAISAILNDKFAEKYPDMVMQAVGLTFGIAILMFLLYKYRIIKPTQKFRAVLTGAILGVVLLYLSTWVLGMFNINLAFMNVGNTSLLGFGINIVIIVIAALSFILDFEQIEVGADTGAPKYMEWYGAFGLTVTLVWLYIEILKLLSRFASSKN